MSSPVTVSIDVPQAREDVYAFLDVMANHESFTDHLLTNWRVSGPPTGLGAKAQVTVKSGGMSDEATFEVIEVEVVEVVVVAVEGVAVEGVEAVQALAGPGALRPGLGGGRAVRAGVAGALAGGVFLGILQAAAIVLFGAGFKNVAALTALLIVLLFFPSGIFAGFTSGGKGH